MGSHPRHRARYAISMQIDRTRRGFLALSVAAGSALLLAGCGEANDAVTMVALSTSGGPPVAASPGRPTAQEPTPPAPGKRVTPGTGEILRGPADVPQVSLIINAGSGYPPADELLDILAAKRVHTTFFLMGWWAEKNVDLVRRIRDEGHEIASHGFREYDLTLVSNQAVLDDMNHAEAVLSGITGHTTRPIWSPSAGYRDARVNGLAASLGYRPILWTEDSSDWREDATAGVVLRRALNAAIPGAIIIFHLDSPRSKAATATVFGDVIDGMRAAGLEPVTISELVGE